MSATAIEVTGAVLDRVLDPRDQALRARVLTDLPKMVGGLNGKMHADLDAKGRPSPWITYRALLAFKRFGALHSTTPDPW